jgi:ABC-type antimicrobial peptide transport system permease subunit
LKKNNTSPPQLPLRFFRWFCHQKLRDSIEGDLMELYEERVRVKGMRKANIRFIVDVILLFRPGIVRRLQKSDYELNIVDMLKHNLLIAIRTFGRHKSSFLINLIGLSTGLTCSLMIYLWVADELNIDKFNEKDDHLYQVMQNINDSGDILTIEGTQGSLAEALAREIPEVEYAVTVVPPAWFSNKGVITFGETHLKASPQFISKDYFRVFTCPIIQGDKNNLLPDITSVAISEELALKLFHTTENLIGKIVEWNHHDYTDKYHITGVFEKPPANATSQFDLLFSYDAFIIKRDWDPNWDNSDPSTFLILREATDIISFNKKIEGFIKSKEPKSESTIFAQRFSDRYLYGNYQNGLPVGGRIFYVQLFSFVGLIILVIACINFVNLTTAKASRRCKEVGVKKTMGASRSALISQYLSESALIIFISLLIAVASVMILLPQFNIITGKNLALEVDATFWKGLGLLFLLSSVLAGSYPAIYLSAFNPATVLKSKLKTSIGELFTRKGLVVFQFSISVILIVLVLVVYKQMEFIQYKNLGYSKENIVSFELEGQSIEKLKTFSDKIKQISGVVSVGTYAHNLSGNHGSITLNWEGKDPNTNIAFANIEVGENFIETMGIEYKEGHSPSMEIDPQSQIVLNEEAIRVMNLKDPIGKKVRYWNIESEIVGVTKNFNFESLHEPIKPSFFRVYPITPNFIVKIQGGSEQKTLQQLQELHSKFSPGYPFDYKFLDESYSKLYSSEQKVSVLSWYFAIITIVISCLGLLGLASFSVERRFKEIGIRKVLGSSQTGIVYLLSRDFVKTVIIAIVIALPVSYLITINWLNRFAFQIDLHVWYFIGAGFLAFIIALVTISTQTVLASKANPVKTLSSE